MCTGFTTVAVAPAKEEGGRGDGRGGGRWWWGVGSNCLLPFLTLLVCSCPCLPTFIPCLFRRELTLYDNKLTSLGAGVFTGLSKLE